MSELARWEPFNDMLKLSTAMDQLFNSAFVPASQRGIQQLPIDVFENEDAFTLYAVVPGIDPNELDITVNERTVSIKGSWKHPEAPQGATFHLREWGTGRFERTIQFPLPLEADAVQAQYESGILTLTLPKAESVKPRRISVQNRTEQFESTAQPALQEQAVAA